MCVARGVCGLLTEDCLEQEIISPAVLILIQFLFASL